MKSNFRNETEYEGAYECTYNGLYELQNWQENLVDNRQPCQERFLYLLDKFEESEYWSLNLYEPPLTTNDSYYHWGEIPKSHIF